MREVIANSMLHRELESAGWITFKVENNIAYVYNPHEYVHKMREAGL